jgi:hypothetical protein
MESQVTDMITALDFTPDKSCEFEDEQCLDKAFSDIGNLFAISVTLAELCPRCSRIALRLGSAMAPKRRLAMLGNDEPYG